MEVTEKGRLRQIQEIAFVKTRATERRRLFRLGFMVSFTGPEYWTEDIDGN